MELMFGLMEESIRVNGETEVSMVKGNKFYLMGVSNMDSGKMEKRYKILISLI